MTVVVAMLDDDDGSSSPRRSDSEDDVCDDLLILCIFIAKNTREDPEFIPKSSDFVDRVVPGYCRDSLQEHLR